MPARLGLTWGLSSIHGWGVFGLNLVRILNERTDDGWPRPLLLHDTSLDLIDPSHHDMLAPLIGEQQRLVKNSAHLREVGLKDTLVLHSSGNGLALNDVSRRYVGERNVGFTFFEETAFPPEALDIAKRFDGMRTGSNWNRDVLLDAGLTDVICVHQGIDGDRFRPQPKPALYADRFVIFTGGKLEFRKGQDIVLAAFKAFHTRHPDALLLSVWQNPWPDSVATLAESTLVRTLPASGDPADVMPAWSAAEGVPKGTHVDMGIIANANLPEVLAHADAAVFANRCEGGTNLAAMECMASNIPCVMSMNSGHLDIAMAENCYPLTCQSPVADPDGRRQGWGESDVDEIVQRLEQIYTDRAAAKARAERAVSDMHAMNWETQVGKLIDSFK